MKIAYQWLAGCVLLLSAAASAHELSNAYLALQEKNGQLQGTLSLKPFDLEQQIGLDINADGNLTWQEVLLAREQIGQYLNAAVTIRHGDAPCPLTAGDVTLHNLAGQTLIQQQFITGCIAAGPLTVSYPGAVSAGSGHKLLVTSSISGEPATYMLSAQQSQISLDRQEQSAWQVATDFIYEGIIHIWIGVDHILFLVVTLLTVNLIRKQGHWHAEPAKRVIMRQTIYLVTAFTLAHSLTLTTTALGWYAPSSRWVEIGIALSVLATALNNLWPLVPRLGWITFAFGLLHGMGFASVFGELQASAAMPLVSIAAFNIGVEIGQLVIVAVLLPMLLLLRHMRAYTRMIMPATSSVIALIALSWAIQRW